LRVDFEAPFDDREPIGQAAQTGATSGSAPPTPSSATCTTRRPFTRSTSTVARDAEAYFATLVSASATTK
jgi:hypothetical protein